MVVLTTQFCAYRHAIAKIVSEPRGQTPLETPMSQSRDFRGALKRSDTDNGLILLHLMDADDANAKSTGKKNISFVQKLNSST